MVELDALQRRTLIWAGLAVVLTAFDGSVLVLALPAIAGDFHARVPALSNLGSVLALGSIGALPLATLADRFGRRRLIAVGVAGFSVANFASAFAPSLEALALLRLVAVCFEVLVGGVATALIVEEAPPGRRGQAVSVLAVLSGIGTGITVLAYPVVAPHWRYLFLAGGVGLLAAPMIWTRLPEGRVWLGVRLSGSALRLLIAPAWRRRLIVIAATTALLAVLLEPAGLLFTLFASQLLHLSPAAISELIIASGVAGAASYVAGGFLSDRFGRRVPGTALTGATAVAASLSFATGTPGFVAGNVLWSSFASAATPVLGAWSAELFPTRARATAEALSSLAAAAGSVAGLQAVGLISQSMSLGTALGLTGVVAFLGALLLLLLPETRGAPLPD
ncbi:MAG TPA: MFS transporter [Candidatus Polarisedimenticolia bacterium]|nr:MFS transporter [Candidatus Polarisedimenticolia bacterium]